MRLNPVTKNEPDYRLFIVHMLVHLRNLGEYQIIGMGTSPATIIPVWSCGTLDERLVTDGERKAALMHFDTSQVRLNAFLTPVNALLVLFVDPFPTGSWFW